MATNNTIVKFVEISRASFDAISTKDENTLYVVKESNGTRKFYQGQHNLTGPQDPTELPIRTFTSYTQFPSYSGTSPISGTINEILQKIFNMMVYDGANAVYIPQQSELTEFTNASALPINTYTEINMVITKTRYVIKAELVINNTAIGTQLWQIAWGGQRPNDTWKKYITEANLTSMLAGLSNV